jgi:soluble lytic murein transglycosylase-like protein
MRDEVAESGLFNTAERRNIVKIVKRLAPKYNVRPLLALAIISAESNFDPNAVSVKNAQGLMQLIPDTAARFNIKNSFDPTENIRGGLTYLRWLLAYYQGDVALVAAGYNAGEKVVDRYRGVPPYPETRNYVKRVLQIVKQDQHPYDARITAPSPGFANRMGIVN